MSYSKKVWEIGDHLKASEISAMSAALEEVVAKVAEIRIPEVPSIDGLATKKEVAAVKEMIPEMPVLDGFATKEEVEEVKGMIPEAYDDADCLKYKSFLYNGQERRTVQLANYDSISGIATDGTGHNLVMLSKWDVADFGAGGVHMNLNSKDAITINDSKVIATVDQIPSVEGLASEEFVTGKIEEIKAAIPAAYDDSACVKYVEIDGRNRIVVPNHVNMLGVGTDGGQYNLAMVSKWDVADFGSSAIAMNLNAKDGKVTINDDKVVATMDVIEALIARIEALEALLASGSGR